MNQHTKILNLKIEVKPAQGQPPAKWEIKEDKIQLAPAFPSQPPPWYVSGPLQSSDPGWEVKPFWNLARGNFKINFIISFAGSEYGCVPFLGSLTIESAQRVIGSCSKLSPTLVCNFYGTPSRFLSFYIVSNITNRISWCENMEYQIW